MDRKNLGQYPPPFYYPQLPVSTPMMYYQMPQFQHPSVVNSISQISPQQPMNTINNDMYHNQMTQEQYINDMNQRYSCIQQNYSQQYPFQQISQQNYVREFLTHGKMEDEVVGCDQFTHDSNNSQESQLKNFVNIPQKSSILISTSIIIQEGPNSSIKVERDIMRDKSTSVKLNDQDNNQRICIKNEEQQKRITANWRFIDVSGKQDSLQRNPIKLKINDIQPTIRENQRSSKKQKLKLQAEVIPEQISVMNENLTKRHNIQETQNNLTNNSQLSEQGHNEQNLQQNIDEGQETEKLSGNLCKNLMRAFNKFAQHYNFQDQSIKVSLFRFLERNTYSNLQLLKIYHNPRYKSIFLEFAKEGAKEWLLQSRVIDINSHIELLQKIMQGDISSIGIKKRKNVSKIITKNIKKKQYGKKSNKKNENIKSD